MENKPKYNLPKSMRNNTLDLRNAPRSKEAPKPPLPGSKPTDNTQTPEPQTPNQPRKKRSSKSAQLKTASLIIAIILCVSAALYIIFLLLAPKLLTSKQTGTAQAKTAAEEKGNRIVINSVGVDAPIVEGDERALEKGAWHRLPNQGDPVKGGNFIVTGHSFVWGYTPQQVKERSIFYSLPEVKNNDIIKISWEGKEYNYKVVEVKKVKPNQTEIEGLTTSPQLTVYTCTPGGSSDGRVVVIAKPN